MSGLADVTKLYLTVAEVVVEAVADPEVAEAWDQPSVLEEQTVGGLVGHLARGGVWLVGEYLDGGVPDRPIDVASAGEYFARFATASTSESLRAIRDRGAVAAAQGHAAVVEEARTRLSALGPRLRSTRSDQRVAVIGGRVMHLSDYLATRLVEQLVHLDDLARSLGHDPYPVPEAATSLVISVGGDVARRRHGDVAVLRALYRNGFAGPVFPTL